MVGSQKEILFPQNELHVRNRMRRWYSGHLLVCSCDSAVRFLDIEKSSQRRLPVCLAPRRVHFARPWTQASKPALIDSSLAAKKRAEALHVVYFFIFSSEPTTTPRRRLTTTAAAAAAAAVYSCIYNMYMIRSQKRRALGALLFLVPRSEPASTDGYY